MELALTTLPFDRLEAGGKAIVAHIAGIEHLFSLDVQTLGKGGLNTGRAGFMIACVQHKQAGAPALEASNQGSGKAAEQG
ncbi:MAG: hypothetical protein EpisKO_40700 [Epibacterium sp.]